MKGSMKSAGAKVKQEVKAGKPTDKVKDKVREKDAGAKSEITKRRKS